MKIRTFRRATILTGLPLALAAAGCQPGSESPQPTASTSPTEQLAGADSPPTLEQLANASFVGVAEEAVTLIDGRWEGEPFVEGGASRPAVGLVEDFRLTGDLDADGLDESVVLLWTSSGGSGTFDYLAVAAPDMGEPAILGTAALGDRVKIRAGRIVDGRIVLDVIQAGPEDAACCPTQTATRSWQLGGDGLIELDPEIKGTMSLAELEGSEWVLTDFAWDEPAPPQPLVTLTYAAGRFSGNAGCNEYFADVEEGGDIADGIAIGPLGSTRKMCPDGVMTVEDRYLAQLGGVSSYGFHIGKLSLSWQTDAAGGVMLFARSGPAQRPAPSVD